MTTGIHCGVETVGKKLSCFAALHVEEHAEDSVYEFGVDFTAGAEQVANALAGEHQEVLGFASLEV